VNRAPVRGAPTDGGNEHGAPVLRADTAREARVHVVTHVRPAAPLQRIHRLSEGPEETALLVGVQKTTGSSRIDARAIEHLVGEQIPHPRDARLVEQTGLNGRAFSILHRHHLVKLASRQ
jgi:hypothetical protein